MQQRLSDACECRGCRTQGQTSEAAHVNNLHAFALISQSQLNMIATVCQLYVLAKLGLHHHTPASLTAGTAMHHPDSEEPVVN